MFINICSRAIEYLFYALFFFVPLIFLPVNYELFEFNKMILTYALTVLIGSFWFLKMALLGQFRLQKTPLDIPIALFLASQIISTIFSIDVHTSIWGYYSRFNGGLASITAYLFLYYAFVSNIAHAKRLLFAVLASGILVAAYGVLEHFGIDKDFWVQDVQNRVFSTLGQPNWLAAYLSILIPIAIAFGFEKYKKFSLPLIPVVPVILVVLFYITLLFTKSRSGFAGLWLGLAFFAGAYFWTEKKNWWQKLSPKNFLLKYWYVFVVLVCICSITFIIGSPFEQLNKFTLQGIRSQLHPSSFILHPSDKPQGTALEIGGGTESGEIRKIVWKGALNIAKAYPLFGSGVETFAYSYYKFRPIEHNLTSEWDFLYNKAHNEYLNYLANTGFVGLGSYLFMIGAFFITVIPNSFRDLLKGKKKMLNQVQHDKDNVLPLALLAGYISILISNFFGFSVVIINLFFFLIPAMVFVLAGLINPEKAYLFPLHKQKTKDVLSSMYYVSRKQQILIVFIILATCYLLLATFQMWNADRDYATGRNYNRAGELSTAYPYLVQAIQKRSGEPQFSEELSINTANLAISAMEQNESTLAGELVKTAVSQSDYTIKRSPNNPNFWRTRIRVFYALSEIDPSYNGEAVASAKKANELSPTDPKIAYNYGLILGQTGKLDEGIKELERAVSLKSDYRDPIYALGLFYYEKATNDKGAIIDQELFSKAIIQMENVLKLASDDAEATDKLKKWRGY